MLWYLHLAVLNPVGYTYLCPSGWTKNTGLWNKAVYNTGIQLVFSYGIVSSIFKISGNIKPWLLFSKCESSQDLIVGLLVHNLLSIHWITEGFASYHFYQKQQARPSIYRFQLWLFMFYNSWPTSRLNQNMKITFSELLLQKWPYERQAQKDVCVQRGIMSKLIEHTYQGLKVTLLKISAHEKCFVSLKQKATTLMESDYVPASSLAQWRTSILFLWEGLLNKYL